VFDRATCKIKLRARIASLGWPQGAENDTRSQFDNFANSSIVYLSSYAVVARRERFNLNSGS
jgi:hypothetical protein